MEAALLVDADLAYQRLLTLCREQRLDKSQHQMEGFEQSRQIQELASLALDVKYTVNVLAAYQPLFPALMAQWVTNYSGDIRTLQAFGRVASLTSVSLPLIEHYLAQNDHYRTVFQLTNNDDHNRETLLACYRLLFRDRERFIRYVDPAYLYTALNSTAASVRLLALEILSVYFQASENIKEDWTSKRVGDSREPIHGEYEGAPSIDYAFLEAFEAKRIANGKMLLARFGNDFGGSAQVNLQSDNLLANMGGVLVPRLRPSTPYTSDFVPTQTALKSVRLMAEGLTQSKPVLVSGQAGSGKTFYIDEAAKLFSQYNNLVRIHLGSDTDAKVLIGTYSTGEKPGSFEWCPGILTVAVKEGRWVLIEDIDKAPTDILSVLLPLLEKRELLIPSRGETIRAKRGFQVFATMKSFTNRNGDEHTADLIGKRMWHEVNVQKLSVDDLKIIMQKRFPLLRHFSDQFVDTYMRVKDVFHNARFASLSKSAQGRVLSTRDLIKWAMRVVHMLHARGISESDESLPSEVYDNIFFEAVDCFASFIQTVEGRDHLANVIGECLDIPSSRVNVFLRSHEPHHSDLESQFHIGRVGLTKASVSKTERRKMAEQNAHFALTKHSSRLIEQVGISVSMGEPLLLVGETGTGKTTVVQYLARKLHKNLTAINVSQQTEIGDLLGGYKPVDAKMIAQPLNEEFDQLFGRTFSSESNAKFSAVVEKQFKKSNWPTVVKAWKQGLEAAKKQLVKESEEENPKKKRRLDTTQRQSLLQRWNLFEQQLSAFEVQANQADESFFFTFVEGPLVQAVRRGDWVLLDEVNLASADTLESISDLLVENPSITLSEKGDAESVKAHPEFRLFACMNPATDVGKRDLPAGLRSRFTELYVHSPDQDEKDLIDIIHKYIGAFAKRDEWICEDVSQLYLLAKKLSDENKIVDGANQKPHFSIRTLTRTLTYATAIAPTYGPRRSLYEGFCMCFMTLLDQDSEKLLEPLITQYTVGKLGNAKSVMTQIPKAPSTGAHVQFKHYWLHRGRFEIEAQEDYIITPFVEMNLLNLARATAGRKFPVLIQGPTSSGKTSMIKYLAKRSGHKFVRINNHEHTDLQEYLGSYMSDDRGQLKFQEGVLVEALRNGYWIVLDELNLAPTDVLEALNRLLDDNRELLIPETQELIKPHPDFMLFATQNPPGVYGGRKVLSRAFRNRFLELHFDDIPQDELETILTQRCKIAPSYSKKIVDVYRRLSVQRQSTRLFEQKNSFATLRDLFRWAGREAVGYEQLALNGYMLLGERVRKKDERLVVKETIEQVMRVKIDIDAEYQRLQNNEIIQNSNSVVWTKGMCRLLVLVCEALQNNEPVLLVGETGCGKTTICQILADALNKSLHIVNAHQNTETGDIIGAQRPVRNRSENQHALAQELRNLFQSLGHTEPSDGADLEQLQEMYATVDKSLVDSDTAERIMRLTERLQVLFEWSDGSLIQALKNGDFFLMDEISLAEDSVLERLNSVLEPEHTLLLSEKGAQDVNIVAADGFQFFGTMNPGGDYGKKELSPALRNRFTEIWVPSMEDFDDVAQIVKASLDDNVKEYAKPIVNFSKWFGQEYGAGDASSGVISLRDILAWVNFVNELSKTVEEKESVFHGSCMVFIDAVGSNASANLAQSSTVLHEHRMRCVEKLSSLLNKGFTKAYTARYHVECDNKQLKIGPFALDRVPSTEAPVKFNLNAPTTTMNALRVIRGMQTKKPILLEGSPGVGKTSLITAIANVVGEPLTRINLSEQTDLIDLFGSDTPAEGKAAGQFVWRDAPFLRAMQQGEWVLLDEMNLASQSVLEGLNACLDHRGETYIPELDKTFKCHPNFTVFAAQNPQYQGGGRKGLPKSFVNRFSVVYVDSLSMDDLRMISQYKYPEIAPATIDKLINFILELDYEVAVKKSFGQLGSPFEFNLRDTMRWFGLIDDKLSFSANCEPHEFFDLVVGSRFRTEQCKAAALKLYEKHFGPVPNRDMVYQIGNDYIQAGHSLAYRMSDLSAENSVLQPLQCNLGGLETAITCVNHSWPLILTGPTNSGKTSLIRFLAQSLGANLHEFSMNGDIDSTDLLGGFDQVDIAHKSKGIWAEAEQLASEISKFALNNGTLDVLDVPTQILKHCTTRSSTTVEELEDLSRAIKAMPKLAPEFDSRFGQLSEQIVSLVEEFKKIQTVRFQWFDGTLLKAVEEGHWLTLDNANLCNPSVLDRLNSLLEDNGCLVVNECAMEDGQPRFVKPHKNFRLFLTVDPRYGELSRAMRNRGVEIYMADLKERATGFDRVVLQNKVDRGGSLEQSLTSLSLQQDVQAASAHIKPSGSVQRYFIQLDDVMIAGNDQTLEYIAANGINVLPVKALDLTTRWFETVIKSGLFFEQNQRLAEKVLEDVNDVKNTSVLNLFSHLYQMAYSAIPLPPHNQPVNPLANTYFTRFATATGFQLKLEDVSLLLRFVLRLKDIEKRLEAAATAVSTKRAAEMSYLVRSAALSFNKPLKNPARVPVYGTVKTITQFLDKTVNLIFNGQVIETNDLLELRELQQVAFDLVALAESSAVDETQLYVYRQILNTWVDKNMNHAVFKGELEELVRQVSVFSTHMVLSSGTSMVKLWTHMKGSYPLTGTGWTRYNRVLALAERFDTVSYQLFADSLESINTLRSALVEMLHDVASLDSDHIDMAITSVERGINSLDDLTKEFQDVRLHFYQHPFNLLRTFLEITACDPQSTTDVSKSLLDLYYYSKASTSSLVPVYERGQSCMCVKFDMALTILATPRLPFLENQRQSVLLCLDDSILGHILQSRNEFAQVSSSHYHQAKADLRVLVKALLENMDTVRNNRIEVFARLLNSQIQQVIAVHKIDDDVVYDKEVFAQVKQNYFSPALESLKSMTDRTRAVSKAWIRFALGVILLYVPNIPFDPAIQQHVEHSRYTAHIEQHKRQLDAWMLVKSVFYGPGPDSITEEMVKHDSELEHVAKPGTYRPAISEADMLHQEWVSLLDSSISEPVVEKLVSECSMEKVALWQSNTTSFISRMRKRYQSYADITEILDGVVYGLKLGLDLAVWGDSASNKLTTPYWLADPVILASGQLSNEASAMVTKNGPLNVSAQVLIQTLRAFSVQSHVAKQPFPQSIIDKILSDFHIKWTLRRKKEEEQEVVKTSVFIDGTEEAVEEEFNRMFPDYEGSQTDIFQKRDDERETNYQLALAYMQLYGGDSDSLKTAAMNGVDVVTKNVNETEHGVYSEGKERVLPSILMKLASSIQSYTSGNNFNFYHEHCQSETDRVVSTVHRVKQGANGLLKRWPEHEILQELKLACQELLNFPALTPVARFLQKVDQIYVFLCQWEENASREVSLANVIAEVAKLIIDWRGLELRTWSKLFDYELENSQKDIGKWWFHLYESIIVKIWDNIGQGEHVEPAELVQALTVFINDSALGQFKRRMQLLLSFANHVDEIAVAHPQVRQIAVGIRNVVQFYSQYSDNVAAVLNKETSALQQQVNEKIKLVTFKDTNPAALKQSTRKSHHDLHKIVRKYRATINQKVTPHVEGESSAKPGVAFTGVQLGGYLSVQPHMDICKQAVECKSRPAYLFSESTFKRLHESAVELQEQEIATLDSYVGWLTEEMHRLRKETPGVLTEDTKKAVSQLRAEKGKLLSDSLKDLKASGLNTTVKANIAMSQAQISSILSTTPSLDGRGCERADSFFFKALECIPRVRSAVKTSETDVPHADLSRALAIGENLMAKLLSVRSQLGGHLQEFEHVQNVYDSVQKIASLLKSDVLVSAKFDAKDVLSLVKWVPQMMAFAIDACQTCVPIVGGPVSTDVFAKFASRSKDLCRQLETFDALHRTGAATSALNQLHGDVISELEAFGKELATWKVKNTHAAFIADVVIQWINQAQVAEPALATNKWTSKQLEQGLQDVCKKVLVIFQDIGKLMEEHVEEGDDKWFAASIAKVERVGKLLRQSTIVQNLTTLLQGAAIVGCRDKQASDAVVAMVGSTLPIIHEYVQLSNSCGLMMAGAYASTAKNAHMLFNILHELASNGFCTPQPPQEEQNDESGKAESGTGLGDGAGGQEHSQDIEEDEDLSEHAQKDNEDQSKDEKGQDEEDNAVDMEGDMAGNMEDAPDQEEDDNDDQDQNENEEPDEEVGDINDLDPNAVDEKMWNDESEEKKDEKEKKSDEVPENSNNDDMQGQDEDENEQESNDKDAKDQGQEEQDQEDDSAEDEDDVGEQDDNVKQQDDPEELEKQAEDSEQMQLPDDMNLDEGDEEGDDQDHGDDDEMPDMDGKEDAEDAPEEEQKSKDVDQAEDEGEENEQEDQEGEGDKSNKMDVDEEGEDNEREEHDETEKEEPPAEEQQNESKDEAEASGEQMNVDTEGLHGPDEGDEDDDTNADQSTRGQQETSQKNEGADQATADEQEMMEQGQGAQPQSVEKPENDEQVEAQDEARKEAQESMKQLGDALKEFHKRQQEIKDAGERDDAVEDTANERPDEFEHLDGAEQSANDTQALGSATQDQIQKIDESMAIDDDEDMPAPPPDQEEQAHDQPPADEPTEAEEAGETGDMPSRGMSSVGERKNMDDDQFDHNGQPKFEDMEEEEEVVEQVDDNDQTMEPPRALKDARDLWRKYEVATQDLALGLCEQLRLILEPTQATKLRGDFKTGKRLNMKRIIPYIASQFKKDKIWMRRTKPSKRQYQIMISVDDSKSMSESKSVDLAFQTIALVSKALTQLEAGQLAITRFGEEAHMIHPFQKPFSPESGAEVLQWFGFDQSRTNVRKLLDKSIKLFDEAKMDSRQDLWQLEIIISDGICEDHDRLRRLVRRAHEEQIMMVFVVVDGVNETSILDMKDVHYDPETNMPVVGRYLDKFPFDYYVIVKDIRELPGVLSMVLRQYFAEVAES